MFHLFIPHISVFLHPADSLDTHAPLADSGHSESNAPPLFGRESAGFQQCVAQLTSYMHRITPAQRTSLIEGLKHHAEGLQLTPDFNQHAASVDTICSSDSKEDPPVLLFPSYSPFQPLACSTPCHDYLSPPPSPWLSPSFSMYATSSFASFASLFSIPPSLSPPSSNTSFFSFSPTVPHSNLSPLTTMRPPSNLLHREVLAPNSSPPIWRPWFWCGSETDMLTGAEPPSGDKLQLRVENSQSLECTVYRFLKLPIMYYYSCK